MENGNLHVSCRTTPPAPSPATNRIYFRNVISDDFVVEDGGSFWIGHTMFVFRKAGEDPTFVRTLAAKDIRHSLVISKDRRLESLARVPELLHSSSSDEELESRVLQLVLDGIPAAQHAALVVYDTGDGSQEPTIQVRGVVHKAGGGDFQPSRQLVMRAIQGRQNEYFRWERNLSLQQKSSNDTPTEMPNADWAVCKALSDDKALNWAIYVTGRQRLGLGGTQEETNDQMFVDVAVELFSAIRRNRTLQERYTQLSRMLPDAVLQQLGSRSLEEILTPRECTVTVLYFDIRGSCKMAEDALDLQTVMDEMNDMMKIMTSAVNNCNGAIGDFQGDAAIACWGWPVDQDDQIELAAKAALAILREFLQREEKRGKLDRGQQTKLPCGIGLAHGRLIAGRLGTPDQFKVALFGHAANLAARLQSMTKTLGAHVLIDEDIAKRLCNNQNDEWWRMPRTPQWCRLRPVAKVRPKGMSSTLMVTELLPPAAAPLSVLNDIERTNYIAYLDRFLRGEWTARPPMREDGPAMFLKKVIAENSGTPPAGWNGIVDVIG